MGDAGSNRTKMDTCRNTNAKTAFANSMGKSAADISPAQLERFMMDSAKDAMGDMMDTCMQTAGVNASKMATCRDDTAKTALAASLGVPVGDVSGQELGTYLRKGAESKVQKTMKACMANAGVDNTKMNACVVESTTAMANALGKNAGDIEAGDMREFMMKGADEKMGSMMEACVESASTKAAKRGCSFGADMKNSLAASLGKNPADVTGTDMQASVKNAATNAVLNSMDACMKSATDISARTSCKGGAKTAMLANLGIPADEVDDADVESMMMDAAKSSLRSTMTSCMDLATMHAAREACRGSSAKAALVSAMGKDAADVTGSDVQMYLMESAKQGQADKMTACTTAAGTNATNLLACRGSAKKNLAASLGLDPSAVTDTDVEASIRAAGKTKVAGTMEACVKAANSSSVEMGKCAKDQTTRRGTVKSPAKEALEAVSGKTVTDVEVNANVVGGAKEAIASGNKACMASAGTNATKQTGCTTKGPKTLAKALGKPDDEVTEDTFLEFSGMSAIGKTAEAMEGCMNAVNASKSACLMDTVKKAMIEAKGKPSTTVVSKSEMMECTIHAAANGAMKRQKACISVATTKETRKLCRNETKIAIKMLMGDMANISDSTFTRFMKKGEKDDMAEVATACKDAGKTATTCDFKEAREAYDGPASDHLARRTTEPTWKTKAKNGMAKRQAAKGMVSSARRACNGKNTTGLTDDDVKACVTKLVAGKIDIVAKPADVEAFMYVDAYDEVAGLMRGCMEQDDKAEGACDTKITAKITSLEKIPKAARRATAICTNPPCKNTDKALMIKDAKKLGAGKAMNAKSGCVQAKVADDSKGQVAAKTECEAEVVSDSKTAFAKAEYQKDGDTDFQADVDSIEALVACKAEMKVPTGGTVSDYPTAVQCDTFAEEAFLKAKGAHDYPGQTTVKDDTKTAVKAEFAKKKTEIADTVKGMEAGLPTKVVRNKKIDTYVTFPVACDQMNDAGTLTAVETATTASITAAAAGRRSGNATTSNATTTTTTAKTVQVSKTTPETGKCRMKFETTMPATTTDDKIEAATKEMGAKVITGTTARRGSSSGTTTASQSTTTCPSTGCGTGSSAVTAKAIKIVQTVQFTDLTTTQYTGDLKLVAEAGYGKAIGIYDTVAVPPAFRANCGVESSASRRAITVEFTATVSATYATAAKSSADTLIASEVTTAMTSVNTAMSKSVTIPTVGTIGTATTAPTNSVGSVGRTVVSTGLLGLLSLMAFCKAQL